MDLAHKCCVRTGTLTSATPRELQAGLAHPGPEAILRYQHAMSEWDAALADAMSQWATAAKITRFQAPAGSRGVIGGNAVK
jgi:hypothetical protein